MALTSVTVVTLDVSKPDRVAVLCDMAGTAPGGAYKVPLVVLYPRPGTGPALNGVGCVDFENTQLHEDQNDVGVSGTVANIYWPTCRYLVSDDFLTNDGWTYVCPCWDKLTLDAWKAAPLPFDWQPQFPLATHPFTASHVIAAATDGLTILADASQFLRNPVFTGTPVPPTLAATPKVIAFGCSHTGMLLNEMIFSGRISSLAAGRPEFPNGLIFEGSCCNMPGGQFRTIDNAAKSKAAYAELTGTPPTTQGRVLVHNSDSHLELLKAVKARITDLNHTHYRVYETAGMSHAPTAFIKFWRSIQQEDQFLLGYNPVMRVCFFHLREWIENAVDPPPSVYQNGVEAELPAALGFGGTAHWMNTTKTFIHDLGSDGNSLGGVRLPHVRTVVDGRQIGAPVAFHRGVWYMDYDQLPLKSSLDARAILKTPNFPYPPEPTALIGSTIGFTTPYSDDVLRGLYRSNEEYVGLVQAAAEYAKTKRWILQEDVDRYVAAAKTHKYGKI